MPIQPYFICANTGNEYHLGTIEPGEVGIFYDRAKKFGIYIMAYCLPNDLCGQIHHTELHEEPDPALDDELMPVELNSNNLVQIINTSVYYERKIVEYSGDAGTLHLEHEHDLSPTFSKLDFTN